MTTIACGRTEPPVELWLAGDVYLAQARPVLDDALRSELPGQGVVNLEGPVGPAIGDGLRLVHDPASLSALSDARIAAASLANNHAADAGPDGTQHTADALAGLGIASFGGDRTATTAGYTLAAFDLEQGVPDLGGLPHPLIVAFHVTGDADPQPTVELRAAVDLAVAAHADIVVAHGTHVFGPVERRGSTVIAWGLGNLAFDCRCTNHTDGLILVVSGDSARVVPILAGLDGSPARLAVDRDGFLDALGALSPTPLTRDGVGATF